MTGRSFSDQGFIGHAGASALVGRDGAIGHAQIGPVRIDRDGGPWLTLSLSDMLFSEQRYVSDTNVLETSLDSSTGSILVLDLVPPDDPSGCLLRVIRGITGAVSAELELAPPTGSHEIAIRDGEAVVRSGEGRIRFLTEAAMDARTVGGETHAFSAFDIREGDAIAFALVPGDVGPPSLDSLSWRDTLREAAADGRNIAAAVSYQGPWRADVVRSELLLHALRDTRPGWCSEPLLAPVAAPELRGATSADQVRALQRAIAEGPFVMTGEGDKRVAQIPGSFWLVDALLAIGELDEALTYFDAIRATANHVALFAEAVVPESGEPRGCFPHAPSHRAFIAAASRLTEALRARDG